MTTAQKVKTILKKERKQSKASLHDIKLLLTCKEQGDYTPMFTTILYTKHGGEYCSLLEILNREAI